MPKQKHAHLEAREFEALLIGTCILFGRDSISRAIERGVRADTFSDGVHKTVWEQILNQFLSNQSTDIEVLAQEMQKNGTLEEIGGIPWLSAITGKVGSSANLEYYCDTILDRQKRRNVTKIIAGASEAIQDLSSSPDVIAAGISNRVLDVIHEQAKALTLAGAAKQAIEYIEHLEAGTLPEEAKGISMPISDINQVFGEVMPGELVVIGARPGCGKSSLLRGICWHIAQAYGDTILYSREMQVSGLPQLFAQQLCGISWRDVRRGQATRDQLQRFKEAVIKVSQNKHLIINDRDRTLDQLVARVAANMRADRPLKAVAVDYLQRYDPQQQKGENRDIALGRFTMAMKDMAMQHNLPVFLAAQIGRDVEKSRRAPMVSDLRESGNIEQDADRVWLLWIPNTTPDGAPQDPDDELCSELYVEMIQAKGRSDGRGKIGLRFQRKFTRFTNWI